MTNVLAKDIKKKVIKLRKKFYYKLLRTYGIIDEATDVKVVKKDGTSYIIIRDEDCWKEILEFKGNTLEYRLELYQEYFKEKSCEKLSS